MATLFFHEMRYDVKEPKSASADRFVLSKGHACPILYAAWEEAGLLTHDDVLSLRKITSDIEGHPTPVRKNFELLNMIFRNFWHLYEIRYKQDG